MAELGYIKSGVDDIKGQLRRHDDLFLILIAFGVVNDPTNKAGV